MKIYLLLALLCFSTAMAAPTEMLSSKLPRFTSLESIGAVVPVNVNLRAASKWSVIGVETASKAIVANAQNRPATLRLKVEVFEPFKEEGWGYRIMAPDGSVTIRGTRVGCRVWAYFRPDQAEALAKVHKGSMLTVSGVLGRADLRLFDGNPGLSVDVHEAKIEKQ